MGRINTNVSSLIAQRVLANNNNNLNQSLERLSTGLKINSGKDDPAGLIASQNLNNEKAGIQQAISNAGRASNVIGTAEGGLAEVSNLLTQLTSLVGQSANTGGLSSDEQAANQLQVDSILNTINRISGATQFNGAKLLNGNYAYSTSSVSTSAFGTVSINSAALPNNATQSVTVSVSNSATLGKVEYDGAAAANTGIGGSAVTLEIAGNTGTQQLSFAGSSTFTQIATAINNISASTGVTASASGNKLVFNSKNYGSDQYVSVKAVSGSFTLATNSKSNGTDAAVTVNGAKAQVNGLNVTYRDSSLDLNLQLTTSGYNGLTTNGLNNGLSKTFGITGGGAQFALGEKVTETDKASIGIQSVSTGSLGDAVTGYLSSLASGGANSLSAKSLTNAQKILDKAVNQVSELRGRLGAFQKFTIGSTVNALGVAYENVTSADSAITDTNFAEETANLTRSQILSQAATSVLSQANAAPQSVLKLLG